MNEGDKEPMSVTQLVGDDKDKEIERVNNKLGNPGFTDKAPPAVIDKEKEKAAGFARDITKLKDQIEKIKAL